MRFYRFLYLTNAISGSPIPNYTFAFGAAGDIPVAGDWDADSHDSVGIVRAGTWYLTNAITGSPAPNYTFAFGNQTDVPVTGMWGILASLDRAAPDTQAPACAKTFSCQPPPDAWYGAKSPADPKSATLHGWTGLNEPPPPAGWTGPGVPPVEVVPPAKSGMRPTPTQQTLPPDGPGPGIQKGKEP